MLDSREQYMVGLINWVFEARTAFYILSLKFHRSMSDSDSHQYPPLSLISKKVLAISLASADYILESKDAQSSSNLNASRYHYFLWKFSNWVAHLFFYGISSRRRASQSAGLLSQAVSRFWDVVRWTFPCCSEELFSPLSAVTKSYFWLRDISKVPLVI